MQDFEVLFERFEMLAAFAYLEATPESELEQALASPQGKVRMPVGRIGWHSSSRERLVQELKAEATRKALIQAGFGMGSEKFTELFIDNLERLSDWMSWQ